MFRSKFHFVFLKYECLQFANDVINLVKAESCDAF